MTSTKCGPCARKLPPYGTTTARESQTVDEKLEQFRFLADMVGSLRFDMTRQFRGANEVLQQHVLRLTMPDGSRSEVHAAMYFRFDGYLIDRMEEYAYEVGPA
ncbi:hypothetical protein [Streptomyces sp. NPDC015125]|uniref:hypothetical protein n=1 Tax=Streptomyces sp. NPDC015125 TaxID=3364938 RepID=UPI0036FB2B45